MCQSYDFLNDFYFCFISRITFDLASLFNGISTFVNYLMPKLSL